jgi:hypothetical protein
VIHKLCTIKKKRNLIIRTVIGEIMIFSLCGVMLYFYYKSKKEDKTLLPIFLLFILLQIISLGILYTYYYELNVNVDNYHFNRNYGGNFMITFIIIFSIIALIFYKSISVHLISSLIIYSILYFYIKTYKKFVDSYNNTIHKI